MKYAAGHCSEFPPICMFVKTDELVLRNRDTFGRIDNQLDRPAQSVGAVGPVNPAVYIALDDTQRSNRLENAASLPVHDFRVQLYEVTATPGIYTDFQTAAARWDSHRSWSVSANGRCRCGGHHRGLRMRGGGRHHPRSRRRYHGSGGFNGLNDCGRHNGRSSDGNGDRNRMNVLGTHSPLVVPSRVT